MSEKNPYPIASIDQIARMHIVRENFAKMVQLERERQNVKWGHNLVPLDRMLVVLGEEFGEVCRAVLAGDHSNLRDELVQVAAVCSKITEILGALEGRR